jgi:prolyl 4-hydroxylase
LIAKLQRIYRRITDRKGYLWAKLTGIRVPTFPLAWLPDGFTVNHAGDTGLVVVENFCTADEAEYLINRANGRLHHSRITINDKAIKDDYRTSQTALVFDPFNKDTAILPLLHRAAMLLGLPASHVETVYVTRYQENQYYKAHQDFFPGFDGDRIYTVLIYLNDLEEAAGGGTVFEKLNIGIRPKLGRAVIWTNTNPDGSKHSETVHEALPVAPGHEKWVIQLWFRAYAMIGISSKSILAPQAMRGRPLTGNETLPQGAFAPGEVTEDSPFAKAFS